ncbi:STARD3 family protein [Megaselia abdita]
MFDIVMAAICRFVVLLLFYAFLSINHWIIISLSTSGSCFFLICKVFAYTWVDSSQQVFQVVLIVTSFVLSWGEAWFLDCRVIPQERHARNYFSAITSMNSDRSPLLAPFLQSVSDPPPAESVANFYSPYDSISHSDEEDEQDQEYVKMGIECVRKAYELLQAEDWKVEKVTNKGDTIQSVQRDKIGKVYRLTGRVRFPAKKLLHELFYRIEEVPIWNPTLLESKIVHKVNTHTDISYNATVGGGGGLIKSRDFVNLRSWRMCRDGKVIVDDEEDETDDEECLLNTSCEGSVSTISDTNEDPVGDLMRKSTSDTYFSRTDKNFHNTLSKSLGAKDFQQYDDTEPPPLEEDELDEEVLKANIKSKTPPELPKTKNRVYVSAAVGIEFPGVPVNPKYTRGENLVSCWAMREIEGKPEHCIFEWLLCLDLKGYIPKRILDTAYTTLMQDYMTYLRKYCTELRQKRKR